MIHITLCIIGVLLAWIGRKSSQTVLIIALLYTAVQGSFWYFRDPAEYYGERWWYLAGAVEAATLASLYFIKHWCSLWVRWATLSATALNIACIPLNSPFYDVYDYLMPCSEIARASCIIVASGPIWHRLRHWYDRRQSDKDLMTWLAKSALIPH